MILEDTLMIDHDRSTRTRNRIGTKTHDRNTWARKGNNRWCHSTDNNDHSIVHVLFIFIIPWSVLT